MPKISIADLQKPALCVPLVGPSFSDNVCQMEAFSAQRDIALVELRIDLIAKVNQQGITDLITSSPLPVIATARGEDEGGGFAGSDEERLRLLRTAVQAGAAGIDMEYRSVDRRSLSEIKSLCKQYGCEIILSRHEYDRVVRAQEMQEMAAAMRQGGADIVKIVSTAFSYDDVLECLAGTLALKRIGDIPFITMCMGSSYGRLSRILCPLFGSQIAYCSVDPEKTSAPGQLTVDEMAGALAVLERLL